MKVCLAFVHRLRYLAKMTVCHEKNQDDRERLRAFTVGGEGP
jgi:hypothetical protein